MKQFHYSYFSCIVPSSLDQHFVEHHDRGAFANYTARLGVGQVDASAHSNVSACRGSLVFCAYTHPRPLSAHDIGVVRGFKGTAGETGVSKTSVKQTLLSRTICVHKQCNLVDGAA